MVTLSGGELGSYSIDVNGEHVPVDLDSLALFVDRLRKSKAYRDTLERRSSRAETAAEQRVRSMLDKI